MTPARGFGGPRRLRSTALLALLTVALASAAMPAVAWADSAALIELVKRRPSGMSESDWRQRRRDAARELGLSGDRKAVPVLIDVVDSERLDEIVRIAIESLGRLGDRRAMEPLTAVYRDSSRDRFTRDAAARALKALGIDAETGAAVSAEPLDGARISLPAPAAPAPAPAPEAPAPAPEPAPPVLAVDPPPAGAPALPADVLAASQRLTLAAGSIAATYDSVQKRPSLVGDLSARYGRGVERPGFGWSSEAGLALVGGYLDRDADNPDSESKSLLVRLAATGEGRFYPSGPSGFFVHFGGGLGGGATALEVKDPMGEVARDMAPTFDVSLGLGPGYGRILDIGPRLRLRRIQAILTESRQLTRPIDAAVSRKIQLAWWSLRGDLGVRRHLEETLRLLREAGLLTGDPPPQVVYKLIRVLEDGQLSDRVEGFDVRLGAAESFLWQDEMPMADNVERTRVETAFLRARWMRQLDDGQAEIGGEARALYRLTGDPGQRLGEAEAAYRRYFYGEGWDPAGALEIVAGAGLADLNTDDDEDSASSRFFGRAAWLLNPNRASRLRLGVEGAMVGRELFLGLRLDGTLGLSDAAFASW